MSIRKDLTSSAIRLGIEVLKEGMNLLVKQMTRYDCDSERERGYRSHDKEESSRR